MLIGYKFNQDKFTEARLFCPQQDRRSCLRLIEVLEGNRGGDYTSTNPLCP